ncbi:unnamed protein product [Parnassius apollo]|uniref:(apollo) hypothetical protein n=1 Tax=Parnassius apollo TaxID=110799 RepID=A0A8S3X3X3_PARAO|nr:unnamed protein product [Parnassius apollo]
MVNTTPTNVVMSLCDDILNLGYTIATDNWYTNLDLVNQLLNHDTLLIVTIKKNRRGLPMAVVEAKLEKGESIAMENQRGINVLKWPSNGSKEGRAIKKPKIILAYNEAKSSVDMSDQMTSYSSPLRKTVKW